MNILVSDIEEILQSADMEGFIQLGAPSDEYKAEAQSLSAAISKIPDQNFNEANVTALVALIWEKQFNLSQDDLHKRLHAFQAVSQKLVQLKPSQRL